MKTVNRRSKYKYATRKEAEDAAMLAQRQVIEYQWAVRALVCGTAVEKNHEVKCFGFLAAGSAEVFRVQLVMFLSPKTGDPHAIVRWCFGGASFKNGKATPYFSTDLYDDAMKMMDEYVRRLGPNYGEVQQLREFARKEFDKYCKGAA